MLVGDYDRSTLGAKLDFLSYWTWGIDIRTDICRYNGYCYL
jgi:hypothetical protein